MWSGGGPRRPTGGRCCWRSPIGGARTAAELAELMQRRKPLTTVDADPAKEAVIREFLREIIRMLGTGEDEL